jgi:hypothetical protein
VIQKDLGRLFLVGDAFVSGKEHFAQRTAIEN